MDILKTSIDWTKAEVFSSSFFILFGVCFVAASWGFSHWGKTEISKAYVLPTLIAGGLLLVIGLGICVQSYTRITSFAEAYNTDAAAFVASELQRADRVLNEYRIAVFNVIPVIILVSAGLYLFLDGPVWRASFVTIIAMMAVILLIDTNADARLKAYKDVLLQADKT